MSSLIETANAAADRAGIPRLLLLACGVAESNLNPRARRPGMASDDERYWPDVSAGVWQQTIRWADEYRGDGTYPGSDEVERIAALYYDLEYAAEVAARNLAGKYRPDEPDDIFRALCKYNWPAGGGQPASAAVEQNYRRGIREALAMLGPAAPVTAPRAFNPDTPTELQVQDWTCSIRSTMWLLKSIGIDVTPGEAQDAMAPRYVNPDDGLLDASGAGIVAVLRDRWGVAATNDASATFDEVAAVAGTRPAAIGLRNWGGPGHGHWSAVRRYDGERLWLANPAGTSPTYSQQSLNRAEFDARGPASMVVVSDAEAPAGPVYYQPGDVGPGILAAMAAAGTVPAAPSTFLPLGRSPAVIEECVAMSGELFRWHLPTGTLWKYKAA